MLVYNWGADTLTRHAIIVPRELCGRTGLPVLEGCQIRAAKFLFIKLYKETYGWNLELDI